MTTTMRQLWRGHIVDILLIVAGLSVSYAIAKGPLHNYISGEIEDLAVLGIVAYMIIVSSHLGSKIPVPVAVIELVLGMGLAVVGLKSTEPLKLLAGIGANMVLFMAGAEIDLKMVRAWIGRVSTLGLLSFAGPALVALAYSRFLGLGTGAMLILIAGFAATSAALSYSILKSTGLLKLRAGQVALTAAMIADIAGIVFLSLATASIDPTIALYVLVLLAVIGLQPILPRISGAPFEAEIRLVAMAIIILGVLSEAIGVHSVLTSFLLGVVVSETVRSRRELREKLESLATGFFTPFFFVASGMSVNAILMLRELPSILVLSLLVILSKFAPSYLYFRQALTTRRRSSIVAASSLVPLLTVTIIAGEAGISVGIIDEGLYSIMIGIVIFSAIASTIIATIYMRR
ncbi:MAG: cation:proton antiporter [Desulfurococcales archaeon]|nr:cation:proton antiporter [Desulfurococcales archaeon]